MSATHSHMSFKLYDHEDGRPLLCYCVKVIVIQSKRSSTIDIRLTMPSYNPFARCSGQNIEWFAVRNETCVGQTSTRSMWVIGNYRFFNDTMTTSLIVSHEARLMCFWRPFPCTTSRIGGPEALTAVLNVASTFTSSCDGSALFIVYLPPGGDASPEVLN